MTCVAEATLDVLRPVFESRIISSRASFGHLGAAIRHRWWDAVKDKRSADKPETMYALKDSIRETIGEIQLLTSIMCLKIGPIV